MLRPASPCPSAQLLLPLGLWHTAAPTEAPGIPAAIPPSARAPRSSEKLLEEKQQAKHIQGNPSEAGTNLAPSPWMRFLDGHHSFPPLPPFIAHTDLLAKSCVGFSKPSCLFPHLKKKSQPFLLSSSQPLPQPPPAEARHRLGLQVGTEAQEQPQELGAREELGESQKGNERRWGGGKENSAPAQQRDRGWLPDCRASWACARLAAEPHTHPIEAEIWGGAGKAPELPTPSSHRRLLAALLLPSWGRAALLGARARSKPTFCFI